MLRAPMRRTLALRRVAVAAAIAVGVACAAAGCKPPAQNGVPPVHERGLAKRLGAVCRWQHGEVAGACGSRAGDEPPPARVRPIARRAPQHPRPLPHGRPGPNHRENGQKAVVVDQLGRGSGFAESGGNLVDAADARTGVDELGQVFTYFGVFPRQAIYERLTQGSEPDGSAWIEVRGHELYEEALAVTTRYTLRPHERALSIASRLENHGERPVSGLELGDAIQWGATVKQAPGKEPGFRGDSVSPFLAGVGTSVAYAVVAADGAELAAKNGTAWSNVSFAKGVTLAPGEGRSYERLFVVAPRGDSLAVAAELGYLAGAAPGGASIALVDAAGAPIGDVGGGPAGPSSAGFVVLGRDDAPRDAGPAPLPLRLRVAGAGAITAEVPPGRYTLTFEGAGRRALAPSPIEVKAGAVTEARLALSGAGRLRIAVREAPGAPPAGAATPSPGAATPAKLQILDERSGRPAVEPILSRDGAAEVPLAAGRYRVVASRGPEYALAEASVDVAEGSAARLDLLLSRVVDTRGYIGCDLHQHTALSADAGVSVADRVLSNAAEGVECAVASEHNLIADLAPAVRALGLEARFRSVIGEELTSDASREPFGHANVFPLEVDPSDARGGALAVRDRTAREIFDAVRALPGEKVLQVNHPRSGRTGYFEQHKLDRTTGVGTAAGYDPRFDALEVWSGRWVVERGKVLEDLWALLRTGHPVTPTASTDTHGIVGQEAGYPRTYIAVPDDDPARLDVGALVRGLRARRDVVLTNGPFVTLAVVGAKPRDEVRQGGLVCGSRGGGTLALRVTAEWAPWMDVSEAILFVGGVAGEPIALPAPITTPPGARRAELVVPLRLGRAAKAGARSRGVDAAEDTFVAVAVRGTRPLEPVLHGDPAELLPFAITAPLWLDADGDGRSLGREGTGAATLGCPTPRPAEP